MLRHSFSDAGLSFADPASSSTKLDAIETQHVGGVRQLAASTINRFAPLHRARFLQTPIASSKHRSLRAGMHACARLISVAPLKPSMC